MKRKSETIEIGAKAIIAIIPYFGGSINSIWNDISASRKFKRYEEFIQELKEEVESLQGINQEYIKGDDFLDIFEKTSRYIMSERIREKRKYYKNIFVNSISKTTSSYDKTENYFRILSDLSTQDLVLLKVLDNPQKFNEANGDLIPYDTSSHMVTYMKTYYMKELLEKLFPDTAIEDIEESALFLESHRLIVNNFMQYSLNTNSHPITLINNKLTKKGKDFISYINK